MNLLSWLLLAAFVLWLLSLVLPLLAMVLGWVLLAVLVVSFLVAFCLALAEHCIASFAGFAPRGPREHLRIDPPQESEDGPDPAFRSYYAGPVLQDYRKVITSTASAVWARVVAHDQDDELEMALVQKVWHLHKGSDLPWAVTMPLALCVSAGCIAGALGALAFSLAASLIFLVLLLVLVAGAVLTSGGARLLEFGVLFVRGITIECPSCHERVTRPIYRCTRCDASHRKLVPGFEGVLRRTCRCQNTLPTLLALGKGKLTAQCADCLQELPTRGLSARTVHIPVIAGPKAGKSVFMQSAVSRLMLTDGGFEFADPRAKDSFERNLELGVHKDPSRALKTATVKPRAYTLYSGTRLAKRLLYLYDPAGEHVESVDQLADAQFLRHTKGVVFIVDPFSLRQVRSETDRVILSGVSASNTAPKDVLTRFVEALVEHRSARRDNRVDIPVAVVLTKCDGLLADTGVTHPCAGLGRADRRTRDQAIRDWLGAAGQRDLVTSLDNNFTSVSCFAVSYEDAAEVVEHGSTVNDDPAAPLRWLLDRKEGS
ncbi:hypothetical protein KCV87_31600 [Actinosynnema pretiosum subsp. pretiosum]|uniref:Double-GTPase 2 domain-containing protein n=1 Tax=Actinosynnema pretiosum subsp. pretiosum TaxID=103721 RepID=A0AA45R3K7_9PSEU|nr:hypothetical protein APASM_4819 [Actinosynnema pretiosum subsp. pretiosum]QUF03859.1 hypothetical protein KCV87_31600 [Actinosynnema pretiosum subsp. pretiosum]